jgi:phosphatidylglycerophosphatase A
MAGDRKNPKVEIELRDPVHFLAFGFGAGLSPVAPGTAGTLMAVPVYFLLILFPFYVYLAVLCVSLVLGVWLCGASSRKIGVHDHSGIVWDEIVGYLLVMAPFSPSFTAIVIGFIAFRVFDILKPWPISWLDRRIEGGFGIMLDDVIAALFAVVLMIGILLLWPNLASSHLQLRTLQFHS